MTKDALAHRLDDGRQFVAADMGVGFVEHTIGGTKVVEDFHHALHIAAFLAAGEEFAIREGTCPTLTKAVVGFGVKTFVAVQ